MRLRTIGTAQISGLCIGGNPFSGFSHQTDKRSRQMLNYYTDDRIKDTLCLCEASGINTFFGRTDDHIFRILREYWDEGGKIQWFAQVCTEGGDNDSWKKWLTGAAELGATGAYLHGGVVDYSYANQEFDRLREFARRCRDLNVIAGFAGHKPQAHAWIRDHVDTDFQMCSYYNPTDRSNRAEHMATGEKWEDEDRCAMLEVVATIPRPVVHYKVFAAGNKPILPAFQIMGQHMRENDVACVGLFLGDDEDMIVKDVALFDEHVDATSAT
jgi:hypothetical protein